MTYGSIRWAVVLSVMTSFGTAHAQTASGQSYGVEIKLGGASVLRAADTGAKTATAPGSFDQKAAGGALPDNPLVNLVIGPTRTTGCADPAGCPTLAADAPTDPKEGMAVTSTAGDSVVSVLPGQSNGDDVLNVVSSSSEATVKCDLTEGKPVFSASTSIDALVIAGTPVEVPGDIEPNTTIVSSDLPLLVLNEQDCSVTADSGTCTVNAVHAQAITTGEVLDVVIGSSFGSLAAVPVNCGETICDTPLLTNSRKLGELNDANGNGAPDPGERILFTIRVVNSSDCQDGTNLTIVDRIPPGLTVDESSIKVAGDSTDDFEIASCGDANFTNGCSPQPAVDPARDCLTIHAGDLPRATNSSTPTVKLITFEATIDSDNVVCGDNGSGSICNTALIQIAEVANPSATARTTVIECPSESGGGQSADTLKTTGSGGCAIGGGSSSDGWPILILGILLALRRRSRNR